MKKFIEKKSPAKSPEWRLLEKLKRKETAARSPVHGMSTIW